MQFISSHCVEVQVWWYCVCVCVFYNDSTNNKSLTLLQFSTTTVYNVLSNDVVVTEQVSFDSC